MSLVIGVPGGRLKRHVRPMPTSPGLYGRLSSLSAPPKPGTPGFKAFQAMTALNRVLYQARTEWEITLVVLRRR